jgi:pimeloyl-ACP methyl ester carboxylesterase
MRHRPRPEVYWRAAGRGHPLVLLNGWSASGLAWPRIIVRELERGFRLVRIDNRGSGFSRFAPTPFTIADLADDVAAVLDAEALESAFVVGVSMGGMIAQEFAIRHPARADGLLLVSTRPPAPAYRAPRAGDGLWDMLRPVRRGETLDAYLTRLWAGAAAEGFGEREPESISELVEQIATRPTSRGNLLHQLRAVSGWGHAERLRLIDAPTIVLHGAQDRLMPAENGRRIAQLIPGARHVELDGVGHLPPLEAPTRLRELIFELAATERGVPADGRYRAPAA